MVGAGDDAAGGSRWRSVTYDTEHGIGLDYLSPPAGTHGAPFFFVVHGGSFVAGNRWSVGSWPVAIALKRGWGYVTVDYRLVPESSAAEGVSDVLRAWEFVTSGKLNTASSSLDGAKGIPLGASAGGHAARSVAALATPTPVALLEIYPAPPLDHEAYYRPLPTPVPHPLLTPEVHPAVLEALKSGQRAFTGSIIGPLPILGLPEDIMHQKALANGLSEEEIERLGAARPMAEADHLRNALSIHLLNQGIMGEKFEGPNKDADWAKTPKNPALAAAEKGAAWPPTCVVHGDADFLVPFALSEAYVAQLTEAGVSDVRLVRAPGGNHGFDVACDASSEPVREVEAFLDGVKALK